MAYSTTHNFRRPCFWNLNLNYHHAQQYIFNVSSKGRLLEKMKKQNAYPRKFQKKIKRAAVSLSKMCCSKYLRHSRNY